MALKLRPTGLGSGIVFGKPADMRADGHAATLDGHGAVRIDLAAMAGVGEAA
jgi:hypothetical protein